MFSTIAFFFVLLGFTQADNGWTVHHASDMIGVGDVWPHNIFQQMWNICNENKCTGRKIICHRCLYKQNIVLEASGEYQGGWEERKRMIEALMTYVGNEGGNYYDRRWNAHQSIELKRDNGDYVNVKIVVEMNMWGIQYSEEKVKLEKVWPGDVYQKLWDICLERKCNGSVDVATLRNGKHVIIEAEGNYEGGWETRENLLQSFLTEVKEDGMWFSHNLFYPGWRTFEEARIDSNLGFVEIKIFLRTEQEIRDEEFQRQQRERERQNWERYRQEQQRREQQRQEQERGRRRRDQYRRTRSELQESYEILDVSPDASDAEIKTQWKAKLLEFHPDKHAGKSEEELEEYKIKTQKVITAYQYICYYRNRFGAA